MSYGITPTGFVIKDFDTIREELQQEAVALNGTAMDTRATNPYMIHLDLLAAREQTHWNTLADLYYNNFAITAVNVALDMKATERGLTRNDATKSQGTLTINGSAGSLVTIGDIFSTSGDDIVRFLSTETKGIGEIQDIFASISSATQILTAQCVGAFGTGQIQVVVGTTTYVEVSGVPAVATEFSCDYASPSTITFYDASTKTNVSVDYFDNSIVQDSISIEAEFAGTGHNVGINEINTIVTAITGISSVTNQAVTSGGTDIESNESLRGRIIAVSNANWTEQDIIDVVEDITGVRSAFINDGELIDTLTSAGQTAESTWWKHTLSAETVNVFRVTFYDDSEATTTDLTESSDATVSAGEWYLDTTSGNTDIIEYRGPNDTGTLTTNDTLTVTFIDSTIGLAIFRVQVVAISPPLTTTLTDSISSAVKLNKPFGVSFFIDEPDFITLDVTPTIVVATGYTLAGIETSIENAISEYLNSRVIGQPVYNAKLIDIIMDNDGVTDVTAIVYAVDGQEVVRASPDTADTLLLTPSSVASTITDEDSVVYTETTHYALATDTIDWDNTPLDDVTGAVADDGGAQTTETTEATNATANDMTLLATSGTIEVNDAYYLAYDSVINKLTLTIGTAGSGVWDGVWEYETAGGWVVVTNINDPSSGFQASGTVHISFTEPTDWITSTVNGITNKYWLRYRVTTQDAAPVTRPLGTQAWTDREPPQNKTYYVDYNLPSDTNVVIPNTALILAGTVDVVE